MTIDGMLDKVETLDLLQSSVLIIQENEAMITELNKSQLMEGLRKDKTKIEPIYASDPYMEMKFRMNSNAGFGTPDLFLNGDFYGGFYLDVGDSEYDIDSYDVKSSDLKSKYGEYIFGLTDDNKKSTKEIIHSALKDYIHAHTGLNFQ